MVLPAQQRKGAKPADPERSGALHGLCRRNSFLTSDEQKAMPLQAGRQVGSRRGQTEQQPTPLSSAHALILATPQPTHLSGQGLSPSSAFLAVGH